MKLLILKNPLGLQENGKLTTNRITLFPQTNPEKLPTLLRANSPG